MLSSKMLAWQWQGKHRFQCEDDMVVFELHGLFNLEDALCMFRLSDEQNHRYGYVLFLFDARDGLNVSQEARRLFSDKFRLQPENRVTAVVGAGITIRTLTRLIQNAGRLFGISMKPVQFCDTMEEGMLWLDMQRQQFRAKLDRNFAPLPSGASKP